VKPLANHNFDASLPLQTRKGAKQALRVGHNKVDELIRLGKLKTVRFGRIVHVTTESIQKIATEANR
jgi:hypothetical protein